MKNQDVCTVNKRKLLYLLDKVLGLYQTINEHCMLMERALNSRGRLHKTDLRSLMEGLLAETFHAFESIGCSDQALISEDDLKLVEGIMQALEVSEDTFCKQSGSQKHTENVFDGEESGEVDMKEMLLLSVLNELASPDKPIHISAKFYIGGQCEEGE